MSLQTVSILGAGQMGQDLAAWCINVGLDTRLVKMTQVKDGQISLLDQEKIQDNIKKKLLDPAAAKMIQLQSFPEFLEHAKDNDLIIETVVENLKIKQSVWQQVSKLISGDTILATNTSSLSVHDIASVLPKGQQTNFLGMHFFTPLMSSRLVELIFSEQLKLSVKEQVKRFVFDQLGKNYIISNDVTGFVANRIGFYSNHDIMYRGEQKGWSITKVDALSGTKIARTKMGPYRLSDLTGLDLSEQSFEVYSAQDDLAPFFKKRHAHQPLLDQDLYGDKVGSGYYKKVSGHRYIFDFDREEYIPAEFPHFEVFQQFQTGNWKHNLALIFQSESEETQFMWETLRNVMYFAAINCEQVTETRDYKTIDRAMVWGYNWKLGPFQLWDTIGFNRVKKRLIKECGPLPEWVKQKETPFYAKEETLSLTPAMTRIAPDVLWTNNTTDLRVTSEKVLIFQLNTLNHTINQQVLIDLEEALNQLENKEYQGLIIAGKGEHFSLGFDIKVFKDNQEANDTDKRVHDLSSLGYRVMSRLKYNKKPIVAAIHGYTLGGGAEIAMHCSAIVAALQTYMGLTEVGVGLIPAGGGLAELADRIYRSDLSRYEKKRKFLNVFNTVAYGKVSKQAKEAKHFGYLRETDLIVRNKAQLIQTALNVIQQQYLIGYTPQHFTTYEALGTDFKAVVYGLSKNWYLGDFVTDFERTLANKIAHVLAGGEVPLNTPIDYHYLTQIEQETYLSLISGQRTIERIEYMIENNKVLRN